MRHKSYKLQDDSVEVVIQELCAVSSEIVKAKETLAEILKKQRKASAVLEQLTNKKVDTESKIIQLLKRKNRTSVTVARVKYYIEDEKLKKQLILD